MATSFFRTSIFGAVFVWSTLALAQPRDIEPVEAKTMAQSGEVIAQQKRSPTATQALAKAGEAKQAKAEHRADAKQKKAQNRGESSASKQVDAKQKKAQNRDNAAKGAAKSAKGEPKQEMTQKRDGNSSQGATALRSATRSQDRIRTREHARDQVTRSGNGEGRQSEAAEHRQERRGGANGAGAREAGAGNGARAGQH
jgi:hypothetical protein